MKYSEIKDTHYIEKEELIDNKYLTVNFITYKKYSTPEEYLEVYIKGPFTIGNKKIDNKFIKIKHIYLNKAQSKQISYVIEKLFDNEWFYIYLSKNQHMMVDEDIDFTHSSNIFLDYIEQIVGKNKILFFAARRFSFYGLYTAFLLIFTDRYLKNADRISDQFHTYSGKLDYIDWTLILNNDSKIFSKLNNSVEKYIDKIYF